MKDKNLIYRLYEYQKERFPVIQYIIYIFLFYYGFFSINLYLSHFHRHYPVISFAGFITVFLIFFQLRLLDEIKDYKTSSKLDYGARFSDQLVTALLKSDRGITKIKTGFLGLGKANLCYTNTQLQLLMENARQEILMRQVLLLLHNQRLLLYAP